MNELFLEALRASLEGRMANWREDLTEQEVQSLYYMADKHHIFPMIYEATYALAPVRRLMPAMQLHYKHKVLQSIALQAMQTESFLKVYDKLREIGLRPCVVKGIVCRTLYGNPDARRSGDEDVLLTPEDCEKAHEVFLRTGMKISNPEMDRFEEYEVPYVKEGSPLYIELHRYLFSPKSEAYGDLNQYFTHVHEHLIEMDVTGGKVFTMQPTDHLFYLICHAFKHFLHSGFGIRQVCDIVLYANEFGSQIDWELVLKQCREIRGDLFSAAIFKIGEKHLTFDPKKACYPKVWSEIAVDEGAMLDDLLESGVYGQGDMSRVHSSNITLSAVIADKRGEQAKAKIWSSVFLPASSLEHRFPYLKKYPFLLPVAWVSRVGIYLMETKGGRKGNQAGESIKLGSARVDLLRAYGIIK